MKVTKEGRSANKVAEAKWRVMVMQQLRALELDPPAPTLADMAEQLRRFIAWHAKECKPRVDALVTKSTQVVHVFMKEKVRQVQKLAHVVLGRDTLTTGDAEQDGWASPFPRTKRPPAPCQIAMGAGQCPLGGCSAATLGGAALPHSLTRRYRTTSSTWTSRSSVTPTWQR